MHFFSAGIPDVTTPIFRNVHNWNQPETFLIINFPVL